MTKQSIRSIAICASLLAALLNIVAAAAQDTTAGSDDLQRRAAAEAGRLVRTRQLQSAFALRATPIKPKCVT